MGIFRPLRGLKGRSAPFLYLRVSFGRFAASKGAPRPFCISGVHSAASRLKGRYAPFLYFRGSFGRFAASKGASLPQRALRALFAFQWFIRPLRGLKGRSAPFLYFRALFGRFAASKGAPRTFCISGVHSAASRPQKSLRALFVFQGFIRPLRCRKGRFAPFLHFSGSFGRFAASKGAPRPFCISGVHSAASRPQRALRALFVFQVFIRPLRGRKGRFAPFLHFRGSFGRFAASKGAPRPFCISGVHSAASRPQRALRALFVFQGFIRPLRGLKGRSAPFLYFRGSFGRFAASKGAPRPFCISGVHSAASRPQRALRALFVFQGFIRPLRGLKGRSAHFLYFRCSFGRFAAAKGALRPFCFSGVHSAASRPQRALRALFVFQGFIRPLRGRKGRSAPFLYFRALFGRFAASKGAPRPME
ncbi:hypothetical protein niasHS_008523 [Heterodera schachtii]|uniref:Uncharacterized protein n=1 Tax=Heterodera schachtii TaxID=97005 RepID=A0ABD2J4R7_HETSC